MIDGGKYSKGNEKFVLLMRSQFIVEALRDGKHVIVDDTNLYEKHEEDIRALVTEYNAINGDNITVEVKVFDTSVDECIARDLKREASVGEAVILKMARQWHPEKFKPVIPELDLDIAEANGLPWCVIYDLDGTAAIMGDRNCYDASKCDEVDRPNRALAVILFALVDSPLSNRGNLNLIAMSGREEKYRDASERFLDKYDFPYNEFYMRVTGDSRKDCVVKKEMYEEHIKGKYNVLVVFDDRDVCVNLWRKTLNLPCFQVNYGDF